MCFITNAWYFWANITIFYWFHFNVVASVLNVIYNVLTIFGSLGHLALNLLLMWNMIRENKTPKHCVKYAHVGVFLDLHSLWHYMYRNDGSMVERSPHVREVVGSNPDFCQTNEVIKWHQLLLCIALNIWLLSSQTSPLKLLDWLNLDWAVKGD